MCDLIGLWEAVMASKATKMALRSNMHKYLITYRDDTVNLTGKISVTGEITKFYLCHR